MDTTQRETAPVTALLTHEHCAIRRRLVRWFERSGRMIERETCACGHERMVYSAPGSETPMEWGPASVARARS